MPRTEIHLDDGVFEQIRRHLLPVGGVCEEAAFLLTRAEFTRDTMLLRVIDTMLIAPDDFAQRSRYYLELSDETRAVVIKRAHDLAAGLIECHSHPGQRGACFSWSDLHGFDEFVPHVQWRLGGRPYAAIVFASDSIDALAWNHEALDAVRVDCIRAGEMSVQPTGFTLTDWSQIYEQQPL